MQYWPSRYGKGFAPLSDYMGQRFLLAWKFSGFETLKNTPLRYVELHTGYYARGFSKTEKRLGLPKKRELYVGLGLNLQQILFSDPNVRNTVPGQLGYKFLQYVQPPFTAIDSSRAGADSSPIFADA